MDTAQQSYDVAPFAAAESFREALDQAGIVFPSLRADASPGLALVELGRVRPEVAGLLADVICQRNRESQPASTADTCLSDPPPVTGNLT